MTRKQPLAAPGVSYAATRPSGWLLAHNSIRPAVDTRGGVNGFRRFWLSPEKQKQDGWKSCQCGWRPDLGSHYSGLAEKAE